MSIGQVIEEGCEIGEDTFIGNYVVMRPNTKIGKRCKISHFAVFEGDIVVGDDVFIGAQSHITRGVIIEDKVFIAPGVITSNDKIMVHMRPNMPFICEAPVIRFGARIGVGVIILPSVVIGRNAVVGAGAIVTRDVAEGKVVYGAPAKEIMDVPKESYL